MPDPKLPVANPLAVWGTILSAAQQGLDTQALFTAIKTDLERQGAQFGPQGAIPYSQLWGRAKSMVNASRQLAAAPGDYAITSQMIGVVPYGATAAGRYGTPRYDVRVMLTVNRMGELSPRSRVIKDIDPNTMTVGELRSQVDEYVADGFLGCEVSVESIDSIMIEQQ